MNVEKCDAKYAELKSMMETPLPKSSAVGAFNWTALISVLPVVLAMFVRDAELSKRLLALVELIRELFAGE